jgi:hypothetical protein
MDRKKSLAAMVGALTGLGAARIVDLALVGGGLATATGAVALAGYMMTRGEHAPIVNGVQYLAIFAQPSHPHRDDDAAAPVGVDTNPIGAISHNGKDQVAGYQMVGAQQSFAWIREGARIFAVHPGDDVPSLGRVGAIEMRDGRWTLMDEKGGTLLVSALAEVAPSAGGRFDKRMIFGAGN